MLLSCVPRNCLLRGHRIRKQIITTINRNNNDDTMNRASSSSHNNKNNNNANTAGSFKVTEEPFYGYPRPWMDSFQPSPYQHPSSSSQSSWVIPTSTILQRIGVTIHSATSAFINPERADAVAALGEITGYIALRSCYDKMMLDPTGQRILQEKPTIHTSQYQIQKYLSSSSMTSTTFGQVYATFMNSHHFNPNDRSPIRYISDPELAYIMLRYRQCHDFWHVLSDLPPTLLGEIALKWVELIQTGLPVAALSATVGSLRLSSHERDILFQVYLPWAIRVGQDSTFLMNVYYEEEMDTDIDELRKKLKFQPAPPAV